MSDLHHDENFRKRLKKGAFESAIWNPEMDFGYVSVPKAANTSIKRWLLPSFGVYPGVKSPGANLSNAERVHQQNPSMSLVNYVTSGQLQEIKPSIVFSVVRDPTDRIISCWQNKVRDSFLDSFRIYGINSKDSFRSFLEKIAEIESWQAEIHFRSQKALLTRGKETIPNRIYRLEEVQSWFPMLRDELLTRWNPKGTDTQLRPLFEVDRLPRSMRRRGEKFAPNRKEIDLIREIYKDDFEFLGY